MSGAASNRESIRTVFHVRFCSNGRDDERAVIDRRRCLAHDPIRCPVQAHRCFSRKNSSRLHRWTLRLPRRGRSPGPTWVKHLMVLRLRGQECYLPADLFDRSVWKRGALEKLARAQYRPAALVELFRKSFQAAQTGWTFWTERGRGIQVEPFAPSRSNPRAALDPLAVWSRSRRQSGPSRCTIPIRICSRWRIAHERHRRRDIAQHSPVAIHIRDVRFAWWKPIDRAIPEPRGNARGRGRVPKD